jgi:hypothetical protein
VILSGLEVEVFKSLAFLFDFGPSAIPDSASHSGHWEKPHRLRKSLVYALFSHLQGYSAIFRHTGHNYRGSSFVCKGWSG